MFLCNKFNHHRWFVFASNFFVTLELHCLVVVVSVDHTSLHLADCCFVCFVALRPKSTAMVIAGRSVHLTTLFSWASLNKQFTSNRAHPFACNWQQPFMNDSAEGRRMTVEIISWSISTKVWDRAGIELATPGSAVSFASVTRHVTDCATRPGSLRLINMSLLPSWKFHVWTCMNHLLNICLSISELDWIIPLSPFLNLCCFSDL